MGDRLQKYGFLSCVLISFLACWSTPAPPPIDKEPTDENGTIAYQPDTSGRTIATRFPVPAGFQRASVNEGSFGYFLRHFSLKPAATRVYHYDGTEKWNRAAYCAVLDLDTGSRDLQQCADAVMRLRAEFLWEQKEYDSIRFHFTNGFLADYENWRKGRRIRVAGNAVNWTAPRRADTSYTAFRKYLNMVFAYAGTHSLAAELKARTLDEIEIGDVFIKAGSPGHAVIVVDKAEQPDTKEVLILLAQSYMPAQDMHVLTNPLNTDGNPWYSTRDMNGSFATPEWRFNGSDLKHF